MPLVQKSTLGKYFAKRVKIKENLLFRKSTIIYFLALTTFVAQYSTFYGEDIVNARDNYLTGSRIDFWGGMSTLIYAHIPSIGVRWQIWLAIFQISITTFGLNKLISLQQTSKRSTLIIGILVSYSSLIFSSQMTRDGLMFSLLVAGLAMFKECFHEKYPPTKLILPVFLIVSGMTFRPWLSLAMVPIVILVSKHSPQSISRFTVAVVIMTISVVPVVAEIAITKSLRLAKSYPEQQVMIMDVAASYCYSNNSSTGTRAKRALKLFSSDSSYPKTACQLYRPDTWLSLTKDENPSSKGLKSDFWLIKAGDQNKYEQVKSLWIKMILKDPVTYLQNKIIFAGKVLIGSDSRNFLFINEQRLVLKFLAIYKIPYDLAITFHLYSLFAGIIFILIGPLLLLKRRESINLEIDGETLLIFLSLFIWLALSSIAYIGSNGRYTYSITLLALVLLFSLRNEDTSANRIDHG